MLFSGKNCRFIVKLKKNYKTRCPLNWWNVNCGELEFFLDSPADSEQLGWINVQSAKKQGGNREVGNSTFYLRYSS